MRSTTFNILRLIFITVFILFNCFSFANNLQEAHGQITLDDKPIFSISVSYNEEGGIGHNTTQYYDMEGKLRMKEKEVFHPNTLELIHFDLKDFKSGRQEEFNKNKDQVVIRYKKNSHSNWKERIQKLKRHLLHGSMLARYISLKMPDLENEKRVNLKLLVPKFLTSYSFDLKKVDNITINGKKAYKIKMYPSSWFLRGIVKSTYFYVEADVPHRLLKFEGYISPKKNNGKSFKGIATFSY